MTLAQPVDGDRADGPELRRVRTPVALVERLDDAAAVMALRSRRVPGWDRAMYLASACGDDGRIWIAAAAFEAARVRSPRRFAVLVGALAVESAVVNLGIKKVARRPRPAGVTEHEFWLRIPTDTSFPSGHAASSALMAVLLSERSPFAPAWVAMAAAIGASRVHVGVHHGSDVVAGWAVGAAMAAALRSTGITRERGPRRSPARSVDVGARSERRWRKEGDSNPRNP